MRKRILFVLTLFALTLFALLSPPTLVCRAEGDGAQVRAEGEGSAGAGGERVPEEGDQSAENAAAQALPEDLRELFVTGGNLTLPDLPAFLSKLSEALNAQLKTCGADLGLFFGGIILSSIFSLLHASLARERGGPLKLCLLLFGCLSVFGACKGATDAAKNHLDALCRLLSAYTPAVTAAAVSMGGVGSAAVSATALGMILAFVGQFSAGVLLPLEKLTLALDLSSTVTGQKALSAFAGTLRRVFLFFTGAAGALLSAVFAFQNVVAAKADGVALRAFRFTAGSAIPLVGGVFSEGAKTLLSGLSLIRSTIGAVGALTVLLMLLPVLLLLLGMRAVMFLSRNLANALEAQPLAAMFSVGASALGMLCAAVAITDLVCVVSFAATMYAGV